MLQPTAANPQKMGLVNEGLRQTHEEDQTKMEPTLNFHPAESYAK